ncbi:MAG: allantoinase AllB [Acetobacterales bacterium]
MSAKTVDLVIRGGTLVTPEGSFAASIAVDGGSIAAIGRAEDMPAARDSLDATGKHVLPGAIDCHVHTRDPGATDAEDWQTASAAAACGGVTTIFDMPSTRPAVDRVDNFRSKMDLARAKSHVDFGLYGLLGGHNIDHIESLSEAGVIGFKCFMSSSLSGALPAPDDGTMLQGFEIIAGLGRRCTVHAENLGVCTSREAQLKAAGRTDPRAHPESRPPVAAAEAVGRALVFAEWAGMRLHIAHESSADALPLIAAARARGLDVTLETCPQYLLLTADDLDEQGGVLRCNPPIRERGHDAALWQALQDGLIDMISTDHAPHLPEKKLQPSIWDCPCGLLGLETSLMLMLNEVSAGRTTLEQTVAWMTTNSAKAWDLYPRKGALQVGSDADIVVVDMDAETVIDQSKLQSKQKQTGFHGRRIRGVPVATLVRGKVVMKDGELVGEPGWGLHVVQDVPPAAPRNLGHTSAAIAGIGA